MSREPAARRACGLLAMAVCGWCAVSLSVSLSLSGPVVAVARAADAGVEANALGALLATEQPAVRVRAALSPERAKLGERLLLFITVLAPPGVDASMPSVLPLGAAFEQGRRRVSERAGTGGRGTGARAGVRERVIEVELIAWQVGEILIPPLPVTFTHDGQVLAVYTEPVRALVVSLVGDLGAAGAAGALREPTPPVPVIRERHWAWVAGGMAAAGLLGLLAVAAARLARRGRRILLAHRVRQPEPEPPPRGSPALEALARLDALVASGALAAEERKPGFAALAEIMRVYLCRRFEVAQGEQPLTTAELIDELGRRAGFGALEARVGPWLARCDLVKYAGARASDREAAAVVDEARHIISMSAVAGDAAGHALGQAPGPGARP